MEILKQQQDEENLNIWHFKIGGVAADDKYRLADLSRETTSPEDWLAANPIEAQGLIDSGMWQEDFAKKKDTQVFFREARQDAQDADLKYWLMEAANTEYNTWFVALTTKQLGQFLRISFRYLWGWKEAVDARLAALEDLQEE